MRQILTVFTYTLREGLRKKTFWVSTIIILALILLLCLAPRILDRFSGGEKGERSSGICYLVDETGIFAENLQDFQKGYPGLEYRLEEKEALNALKKQIKEEEGDYLIHIETREQLPAVHIFTANLVQGIFGGGGIDAGRIGDICDSIWQREVLSSQGVDAQVIQASQVSIPYTQEQLQDMDVVSYLIGIILLILMFFAIYYYGYGVAMSVASEKTSRVMETLIISAKPSRILLGKCLAMGALGILQLGGLAVFGTLCVSFLIPEGFQFGGISIDFSSLGGTTALLLLLVFVLGYGFYAVINSVCGAAVSRVEDLNSAMMPVSVLSIIGFYLGYMTCIAGGGSNLLAKLAMYLPISSPFTLPFKVVTGDIETTELCISILILVLSIILTAAFSIKLYSASVMHYGNRLKWKDMRAVRKGKKLQ